MKVLIPMVATSLLLGACGSSSNYGSPSPSAGAGAGSSNSPQTGGALVKTAANSGLGATILVNAHGLTLYHLSGERSGKFICTNSTCLQAWHPLVVAAGSKPNGSVNSLAVVKRPDGIAQVAYKGMPLYTFVQDTAPGQAHGQGLKDVGVWSAIKTGAGAASRAAASNTPAPQPSAPASSSNYGY